MIARPSAPRQRSVPRRRAPFAASRARPAAGLRGLLVLCAAALLSPLGACAQVVGGKPDIPATAASADGTDPTSDPAGGLTISLLPWPPEGVALEAGPYLDLVAATELRGDDAGFGGFSGIEIGPDGRRVLLVSDAGRALLAEISRDAAGAMTGVEPLRWGYLRNQRGRPPVRVERDAEGAAAPVGGDPGGPVLISFERYHRIDRYADTAAPAQPMRNFSAAWPRSIPNAGVEALALAPDGRLLIVREAFLSLGPQEGWVMRPGAMEDPAPAWDPQDPHRDMIPLEFPGVGALRIVGADIDADGRLWTVERGFGWFGGFFFDLSVRAPEGDRWGAPLRLLHLTGEAADNAEGLAVWTDGAGRTRLAVVSDDNFSLLQRTVLYDFAVRRSAFAALSGGKAKKRLPPGADAEAEAGAAASARPVPAAKGALRKTQGEGE